MNFQDKIEKSKAIKKKLKKIFVQNNKNYCTKSRNQKKKNKDLCGFTKSRKCSILFLSANIKVIVQKSYKILYHYICNGEIKEETLCLDQARFFLKLSK